MRTKHFLTAMVLPALFAACTQEEVAFENDAKVDLSNRPVLSGVTLSFGEADTRMSVEEGKDYAITPDAEDGLGACIIDAPLYTDGASYKTMLATNKGDVTKLYELKTYISSNYRYSQAEENKWETQALMSEGNYVFYAPHSDAHLLRMPLTVKVPVEQNATAEEPNKAIKEYYANATEGGYPIVLDYKFLKADAQDKVIGMNFKHIMAYPLITLKNDYTKKEGDKDVAKAVKVTKVVLKKQSGKFTVEAPLLNGTTAAPKTGIAGKALGGDSLWIKREIEDAATSQVLGTATKESETITVKFGEGVEIAGGKTFSFYVVMPAENYTTNQLVATVYTADNKQFETSFTLGKLTMNPGKRYPAQEYNTRMNEDDELVLKPTKGQLATISMKGELVDVQAKATGLKNNDELYTYLREVATRYRDLKQVNEAFVERNVYSATDADYVKYDRGLHFTLADDAKIIINDQLIDSLNYYIYEAGGQGSIKFLAADVEKGKVVLGNTTKLGKYKIKFNGVMDASEYSFADTGLADKKFVKFGTDAANVSMTLSAGTTELKSAVTGITEIVVPEGATLNLAKELEASARGVAIVNNGGTINVAGGLTVNSIANNKGNLNLNGASVTVTTGITNGALTLKENSTDVQEYDDEACETKDNGASDKDNNYVKPASNGTITIAEGVTVSADITNHLGSTINNNGYMTSDNNVNGGTIVMDKDGDLKVGAYTYKKYTGVIDNNKLVVLTGTIADQDVVCTLKAVPAKSVEDKKINHVIFTANVELAEDVFDAGNLKGVTRVDLKGCTKLTTKTALTGNGAKVVEFYIYNDMEWFGNPITPVTMTKGTNFGAVKLQYTNKAENKTVNLTQNGVELSEVGTFE